MSTDVIFCNILRMPFDDRGDPHLVQLRQICQEAANELVGRTERIAELQQENAMLKSRIAEIGLTGVNHNPNNNSELQELHSQISGLQQQLQAKDEYLEGLTRRLDDMIGVLSAASVETKAREPKGRLALTKVSFDLSSLQKSGMMTSFVGRFTKPRA